MRTHDIVITADESNMLNHQLSFLAGFLSCVPHDKIPAPFRRYVERKLFTQPHSDDGIAKLAILPLRRLESALLEKGFDAVYSFLLNVCRLPVFFSYGARRT